MRNLMEYSTVQEEDMLPAAIAHGAWIDSVAGVSGRRFETLDWPAQSNELYRRTDIAALNLDTFVAPENAQSARTVAPAGSEEGAVLLFSGSRCRNWEIDAGQVTDGLVVSPLAALALQHCARSQELTMRLLNHFADDRIAQWHGRDLSYGAYVHVPAGMRVEHPVKIRFGFDRDQVHYTPHVVINVEEGAEVCVAISYAGGANSVVNAQVITALGNRAQATVVHEQNLTPETSFFLFEHDRMEAQSRFVRCDAALGAGVSKTNIVCDLAGEHSEARLDGVFLTDGSRKSDIRVEQLHNAPFTNSRATYKGAVRDSAVGVFQGLITVSEQGRGTDAFLSSKNLVLNAGARIDSIPSLKINTNDVRCSHGSTTSRIREDELFYLMSRGLERSVARKLIVVGFFDEILDRVGHGLADAIRAEIELGID